MWFKESWKWGSRFRSANSLNEIHVSNWFLWIHVWSYSATLSLKYSSQRSEFVPKNKQNRTSTKFHEAFFCPTFSTQFGTWKATAKFIFCKYRSPLLPQTTVSWRQCLLISDPNLIPLLSIHFLVKKEWLRNSMNLMTSLSLTFCFQHQAVMRVSCIYPPSPALSARWCDEAWLWVLCPPSKQRRAFWSLGWKRMYRWFEESTCF